MKMFSYCNELIQDDDKIDMHNFFKKKSLSQQVINQIAILKIYYF